MSKNIENNFTEQLNGVENLSKYEENWKDYFNNKDFDGMYINIEKPIYSFRKVNFNGEKLLLLGGGGHKTGEMQEKDIGYNPLIEAVKKWFPDCKIKYKWSANDCISLDKIPYIGEFSSLYPNIYVGTGFNKWGITTSFYKQIECGAKNPSIQKIKEFKKNFPTANTDEIFLT